jgi:hypothetical protein
MPKSSKRASAPQTPVAPHVGDKVKPGSSEMVYEIDHVSQDGSEVNLYVPGTNLQRFRVKTDTLTYVERKPPTRTSNPSTHPEPVFDGGEMLERIETVQRESLKQSDDDIDILKTNLKTQLVPKEAIEALEDLTVDQHKAWKIATGKIKKALGE